MKKRYFISGFLFVALALSVSATGYKYVLLNNFDVYLSNDTIVSYQDARNSISNDELLCEWSPNPYIFFSENVFSDLIYYSHLFPLLGILLLALFVVFKNGFTKVTTPLFFLAALFSIWSLFDLFLWATERPDQLMLIWALLLVVEFFVYLSALWLHHSLIFEKSVVKKATGFLYAALLVPIILFLPTTLNLSLFDYSNCDRSAAEGLLWSYLYIVEIFIILLILFNFFNSKKLNASERGTNKRNFLLTVGIVFFLLSFMLGNIVGTFSDNWTIAQYGLLGMPIFLAFIGYVIVKYRAFEVRVFGAQILVMGQWLLVGSLLLVVQSQTSRLVAGATLIFTSVAGFFLIRSVSKEVQQREELEKLTDKLEEANGRLKELDKAKSEFVSIASHQLRSPLTAIRGYASMLAEGSFGQLPVKAAESAKRIEDSAKLMAMSIEDYLNVSRIESGNMKYNLSDFNLVEMANHLCDDLRPEAMGRNLILLFRSNISGKGIVNADVGKTNQIIHNLINNSIKYTPKGSVSIFVHDDLKTKKIYIDIIDTGIGMSKETIDKLFGKFSRASNANSVNTSGTGLGLYVALKMAQQMGGDITCTSEGDGKGSTFTFELPMTM